MCSSSPPGVGFQFGFGSISYFLLNEITPFYIRSASNAVANWLLFLTYFLTTFVFPFIKNALGFDYVFLIFSFLNLFACYFIYFYLPETRGISIEVAYKLVDEKFDSAPSFDCNRCRCQLGGKGHRSLDSRWASASSRMQHGIGGATPAENSRVSNLGETLSYYDPIADVAEAETSSLLRYTD